MRLNTLLLAIPMQLVLAGCAYDDSCQIVIENKGTTPVVTVTQDYFRNKIAVPSSIEPGVSTKLVTQHRRFVFPYYPSTSREYSPNKVTTIFLDRNYNLPDAYIRAADRYKFSRDLMDSTIGSVTPQIMIRDGEAPLFISEKLTCPLSLSPTGA